MCARNKVFDFKSVKKNYVKIIYRNALYEFAFVTVNISVHHNIILVIMMWCIFQVYSFIAYLIILYVLETGGGVIPAGYGSLLV